VLYSLASVTFEEDPSGVSVLMVQFNFSERTIKAKVVYYGPAQSGKTTNLEQIHRLTDPEGSNRLISLNTAQDRTLFFDLLPFSLGAVSGYDFKVQIYTVPGQVQYNATRRVVLAGADAVVFVADSQKSVLKENISAFENMKVNLLANRLVPEKVPLVLQYNKRDLAEIHPEAELNRALNFWGRKAFPAVAAGGQGVIETFVAIVQDMLAAIAVKYNLKEKGLDPDRVPDVVAQAFSTLLKKAPKESSPGNPARAPAKVVVSQAIDAEHAYPLPAAESGLVSEELLHRAIRSNVELAEALTGFVHDMNEGVGTILGQVDVLLAQGTTDPSGALGRIQHEAARLRRIIQQLGQASTARPETANPAPPASEPTLRRATAPPSLPRAGPPAAVRAAPAVATASATAAATPPRGNPASAPGTIVGGPVSGATLDGLLRESVESGRATLETRGVSIEVRVAPGTPLPRCPPPQLRRAAVSLLMGLAAFCPRGSSIVARSERKPVLLRTKSGEVKRDFVMLGLAHHGALSAADQQRILQGADTGPLGDAHRLVREMGGFLRFAPLPGGTLETRVFLPAA
jgi:signal recognition particle receptor subunit beta